MNNTIIGNKKICQYSDILFKCSRKVNVISKKISHEDINLLVKESLFLGEKISFEMASSYLLV